MNILDNLDSHYIVFSSCKFVKGVNRSLICDLQRNTYTYIPNDMYDVIINNSNYTIQSIVNIYGIDNLEVIVNYFKYLVQSEVIHLCTKNELNSFPPLNSDYIQSSIITNAIIDISYNNVLYIESIFYQLEELGCSSIHIKFYFKVNIDYLKSVLSSLNLSTITSIELFIPFDDSLTIELVSDFANMFNRLFKVVIYNSPKYISTETNYINTDIIYLNKNLNEKSCGVINEDNFVINFETYFEGLKYNSCLNRKISIDRFGEIKNCPSMAKSYGNIIDTKIIETVVNPEYTKLWFVNKNIINTCNVCEHRFICTDCRAFLENPLDEYSKPLKCGYDPYTNKWENWSDNPIKSFSIKYYNLS